MNETTKISLRLSDEQTAKVDARARTLSEQASGIRITRTDVLRLALERLLTEQPAG